MVQYVKTVAHIINLLRIKPADRLDFIKNFTAKARIQDIDLDGIHFFNTSFSTIPLHKYH